MLFGAMSKTATAATTFTPAEREYIRRELDMFFSTYPTVAEGFQLKTWHGGPQAGQPKLPPVAQSLLDRGLMRLDADSRPPHLFFTDEGLIELRAMMADRRLILSGREEQLYRVAFSCIDKREFLRLVSLVRWV